MIDVDGLDSEMKVGSLALGCFCVLASASAAWSTDAVVPDELQLMEPDHANACDRYGTGFFQLPGMETCARVSGQMSYEQRFSTSDRLRTGSIGRTSMDFETRSN